MRLMLGYRGKPSLLVEVGQEYGPNHFDFKVINGRWEGVYYNGYVSVLDCPSGDYSLLEKADILCDDQDRLRSVPYYDYQEVFNNFHNPAYVAPKPKPVEYPSSWDDDIAF
jgi:hypothetical protein